MTVASTPEPPSSCSTCGDRLMPGPFGQECLRCSLSLALEEGDDLQAHLAELFPELQLVEKIARGGFGTVFRAKHRRMRRLVALKFLDAQLAHTPEAVAMFEREMIHVGGLDHPGIVRAHDAGERDGHWYILMEFLEGADCGALVRRHRTLPLAESCEIIRQAALALHYAHGQGLVHRDVKPGNLMVTAAARAERGEGSEGGGRAAPGPPAVKVLDFGLAGLVVAPLFADGDERFLGTLEYVAPEQIETPHQVDARADIYSLGATLRRMLTGVPLREGGQSELSLFQHMKKITSVAAAPLAELRPDLPAAFHQLCDSLLAIDPAARPGTAEELAGLLEPWCAGADLARLMGEGPLAEQPFPIRVRPFRQRRRRLAFWALGAALILALAGFVHSLAPHLRIFQPLEAERPPLPPLPAPTPSPEGWRPIFSAQASAERRLDAAMAPRLLDPSWAVEKEHVTTDSIHSARPLPGGGFASLESPGRYARLRLRGVAPALEQPLSDRLLRVPQDATFLGVAPDTGHFIWCVPHDEQGLHLRRARPDGTLMAPLRYDFAAEFPAGTYELGRAALLKGGNHVADGYPWSFAFVTAGQVPPGSTLRVGDVLVADEGNREFIKGLESRPGVWRCRFDSDAPAQRFGAIPHDNFPCDVAVARSGVFLLNRTDPIPSGPIIDADRTKRVWRETPDGFRPCFLDRPIYDPCAIAADPLSRDLYVAQGGLIPSATLLIQQVFRLRPVPGTRDQFSVEVVAERFGKLAPGCLAFTLDGRLVIMDSGNRVIVVLQRKP